MPRSNDVLWLVKNSHMTCNIQSECFISAKHSYEILKFTEKWKSIFSEKIISATGAVGRVVSVFSFYSNDQSLSPPKIYNPICKNVARKE